MGCGSSVQVTPVSPDRRVVEGTPREKQTNGGKVVHIQENGTSSCSGESGEVGGVETVQVPQDEPGRVEETLKGEQEQEEGTDGDEPKIYGDQVAFNEPEEHSPDFSPNIVETEYAPEISRNTVGNNDQTSPDGSSEVFLQGQQGGGSRTWEPRKQTNLSSPDSAIVTEIERTITPTPAGGTDSATRDDIDHQVHDPLQRDERDAGISDVYDKTKGPDTILSQGTGQMDSHWDLPAIVLDCGTDSVKAGFAGEDTPTAVVPTVVGTPRHSNVFIGAEQQDCYIGDHAMSRRGVLSLRHPIANRYVKDWDDWEKIVHHVITTTLRTQPDSPVLLVEPAQNPTADRERIAELMFEALDIPGLYLASQAVLALFASGRTTGVVVDCGAGLTHVVPVYEGEPLIHAIQRIPVAGQDVTEYLGRLLAGAGHGQVKTEIVNQVKNQLGYVALDYDAEVQRSVTSADDVQTMYELPDGQVLSVGAERFMAPEVIFRPELIGKDCSGLPGGVLTSIMQCDADLRRTYLENVFLSGGTASCPGLTDRLCQDITSIAPDDYRVMVQPATPDPQFSAWKGGAVLAALRSFQNSWITQEHFEEYGPSIIHRRV